MKPPRVGPMTDDMPNTPATKPWYLPRSAGGKRSPTATKARDISAPPPIPWMALKAMSWFIVWLSPASAEPTRKTTTAAT